MAEAYAASPLIAGAMNLYGAYEGLGRLTSDEGVAKTVDKFGQGDWKGGLKSLGGDVFDVALSLPVLNRMRQSAQAGSRVLAGNQAAKQFSRMSPHYNFQFNWKTGKFNLTPKSEMPSKATSVMESEMLPTQQVTQYDDLLRNNNYIRNQDGSWTHNTDNGVFTFGDNGEITFTPHYGRGIQLQPDEVEKFIQSRNAGAS